MPLKDVWISLLLSFAVVKGFANATFKMCCRFQDIDSLEWSSVAIFFIWFAIVLRKSYVLAPWSPGMKTNEERAMLITFPLPVSTPLEGVVRMTRQCRGMNARLRERRRLKNRLFPGIALFLLV